MALCYLWAHFAPNELLGIFRLGLGRRAVLHETGNDEEAAENLILPRADQVGGLPRYVLCDKRTFQSRYSQVQGRIKAIAEKELFFDGHLTVESTLKGKYLPSVLMYTKPGHLPKIVNGEPQLKNWDHYTDSEEVWLHSLGILDQIWSCSFERVIRRINRANSMQMSGSGWEFEDLVACMLTRPNMRFFCCQEW